jgi:hypothetical protein
MKPIGIGVLLLLGAIPWSCSSTHPVIVKTRLVETRALKQHCRQHSIGTPEVGIADSLMTIAEAKRVEGQEQEAYWISACAAAYYTLATKRHELALSRKEVESLKRDLAEAKEEVRAYGEVVRELETMGQP